MPAVSFSLTDKVVINPILSLRTPPTLKPDQTVSWTATVWQGVQSEVIARVVAVFTSVFAAADALIHFTTGMYKGACLLARTSSNKSDVYAHFRQAARFAGLTVVGSIAGVVWPGIFKHCSSNNIKEHNSKESENIRLSYEHAGKEIRVPVGKPFSIELTFCTSGHDPWKISQMPSFINHSKHYIKWPSYPSGQIPVGGGIDYIFIFEPEEAGKGNIVMQLPDPSAPSRTVEKTFTIIAG